MSFRLKKLINRITEMAVHEPLVSSTRRPCKEPGKRIRQLPDEERALLKEAKSEDFRDVRTDFLKLFIGDPYGFHERVSRDKRELERKFNRRKL